MLTEASAPTASDPWAAPTAAGADTSTPAQTASKTTTFPESPMFPVTLALLAARGFAFVPACPHADGGD